MRWLEASASDAVGGTAVPNLDFLGDTTAGFMIRLERLAAGNRKIWAIVESASRARWPQKLMIWTTSGLSTVPA